MANEHSGVKFFVIYTIVLSLCSFPNVCGNEEEGESPLLEIVQSLLQESARNQKGGSGKSYVSFIIAYRCCRHMGKDRIFLLH